MRIVSFFFLVLISALKCYSARSDSLYVTDLGFNVSEYSNHKAWKNIISNNLQYQMLYNISSYNHRLSSVTIIRECYKEDTVYLAYEVPIQLMFGDSENYYSCFSNFSLEKIKQLNIARTPDELISKLRCFKGCQLSSFYEMQNLFTFFIDAHITPFLAVNPKNINFPQEYYENLRHIRIVFDNYGLSGLRKALLSDGWIIPQIKVTDLVYKPDHPENFFNNKFNHTFGNELSRLYRNHRDNLIFLRSQLSSIARDIKEKKAFFIVLLPDFMIFRIEYHEVIHYCDHFEYEFINKKFFNTRFDTYIYDDNGKFIGRMNPTTGEIVEASITR